MTAGLIALGLVGCSKQPSQQPPPAPPPLGKQGLALSAWKSAQPDPQDQLLLAHAAARGKTEAMVMVATEVGSAPAVATAIAALGGDIRVRVDDVGYLRVRLPLDRLSQVSALADVLMAHLDGGGPSGSYVHDRDLVTYPLARETSDAVQATAVPLVEPSADTLLGADSHARVPAGATLAENIEGLLLDAADPSVEVLLGPPAGGRFPEAGEDLFALMANRAAEVYGKPMFGSAGETGLVESISGAASGRRVIAVGEYENVSADDRVAPWSSHGPASDGGSKPDLLAPGSTANIAEAATSLIAAARAENLPADARHISWALRMGARRLQDVQAHEQGFGVLDVTSAIDLLKQLQARKFELPDILTRAPVKTYLARFLPEPGVGQGLYEREGWLVGQRDTRSISLLRQSGPATPLEYSLQWRGNNGTFATAQQAVSLPLNVAVDVKVEIAPRQVGIHSAHLYLIDKASELPVHAVLATIVASEQFTAANGYTIQHRESALPGLRAKRYFLEVPPNVSSLRVDLAVGAGQVEMMLATGGPKGAGFSLAPSSRLVSAAKPVVMLVPNPPPGVYELALLPPGLSKEPYRVPAEVQVAASIRYVHPQLDAKPPKDNATTLWMNNIYAPLQRSSVVAEIGARRVLQDRGGQAGMRVYNINVASGSSSLRVAALASDGRARMGIYLYDCAAASCRLWGSDVFTKTAEKSLVVPNPRAGLWKAVIDAGGADTAFKYTEIMTHPRFGNGTVGGDNVSRRIGARWNQKVSYQVNAPAPFGYELVGVMDVIDSGSEADERAAPYSDWEASGDVRNQPLRPVRLTTQVVPLSARHRSAH